MLNVRYGKGIRKASIAAIATGLLHAFYIMEIKTVKAKTTDVAEVIETIADATENDEEDIVMLACLGTAVLIQAPDIDPHKFLEVIQATSEFIALQLATVNGLMN